MAGPYTTPIPGSPSYAQASLLASTAYQKALSALNQKRQSTLRSYGYAGDIDPATGTIKNLHVDPFNAYGSYQTLLRNSATASEHAVDDAVGRGLRGGLAHQAESQVQYDHGAQSADLGRSLTDNLYELQNEQDAATEQRDQALYEAELEADRNAMDQLANNGYVNLADTSDISSVPYGGTDDSSVYTDPGTDTTPVSTPTTSAHHARFTHPQLVAQRDALVRKLLAKGVQPYQYAKQHPKEASRLGLRPKKGANVAAVRHARGGR